MKIVREIEGVKHEFELSNNELFLAYQEQEHLFDQEDVETECMDEDELMDNYGLTMDEGMALASDMAYDMRHEMDKHGYSVEDARMMAIRKALENAAETKSQLAEQPPFWD